MFRPEVFLYGIVLKKKFFSNPIPYKKLRGEKMFRPEVISLCVDETYSIVILQTKFLSP